MDEITNEVLLHHPTESGMSGTVNNHIKDDGRTANVRSRTVNGRDADDDDNDEAKDDVQKASSRLGLSLFLQVDYKGSILAYDETFRWY